MFYVWLTLAFFGVWFHEPWRDEAAAWLIACNSPSLWELLIRSSIEATGPIYYLLLRLPALWFPGFFPGAAIAVSLFGVALFVRDFSQSEFIPLRWRWAVCLGFLIGFEYAAIARLYGWGCFFVWRGFLADSEEKRSAAVYFSLACLTQLSFVFPVLGWCVFRLVEGKSWKAYWPLALGFALVLAHGKIGAPYRHWNWVQWDDWRPLLAGFGSTVATPFIQGPHLATGGVLILLLAFFPLRRSSRLALAIAMAAFVFIFVFRYHGNPQARHGGGVFLLWLALAAQGALSRRKQALVLAFLVVNCITGMGMRVQDIIFPFSHAAIASKPIALRAREVGKPIRLYVRKGEDGLTLAALLRAPIWYRGRAWGCPFFPEPCANKAPALSDDFTAAVDECAETHLCVMALDGFDPAPTPTKRGHWRPLFQPTRPALRESISVYEFVSP